MGQTILYLGDTALDQAASYLAGILDAAKIEFRYAPSDQAFDDAWLTADVAAVVLSDYPSANFTGAQLARLGERVRESMGLLMIGGWESFTGCAGGYNATCLKDILPVRMSDTDDRVNSAAACVIRQEADHPIAASIPFRQSPPCLTGYNRLTAKPETQTVLSVVKHCVTDGPGGFTFACERTDPLLVVGVCGKGRVGAYASDVAPHWSGGFVDWGQTRMALKAPGAEEVEVGNWYIRFFRQMIQWISE